MPLLSSSGESPSTIRLISHTTIWPLLVAETAWLLSKTIKIKKTRRVRLRDEGSLSEVSNFLIILLHDSWGIEIKIRGALLPEPEQHSFLPIRSNFYFILAGGVAVEYAECLNVL